MTLEEDLMRDEGFRSKPYRDTNGILTIGYGRNLESVGLSKEEALYLLRRDIQAARAALEENLPWWRTLVPARRDALTNMCFNMGIGKLLEFRKMLALMKLGDFKKAGREALDSDWAKQVGARAIRIANAISNGGLG